MCSAGVQDGDVIMSINGSQILTTSDVMNAMKRDQVLNVHVKRGTRGVVLRVVAEELAHWCQLHLGQQIRPILKYFLYPVDVWNIDNFASCHYVEVCQLHYAVTFLTFTLLRSPQLDNVAVRVIRQELGCYCSMYHFLLFYFKYLRLPHWYEKNCET